MGRIYLLIVVVVLGILFVRHDKLEPIGGHFAVGHSILGASDTKLYYTDPKYRIERQISSYKFYSPDCLLFTTHRTESKKIYAVCGNRTPVLVGPAPFQMGKYGLERPRIADSTENPNIRTGSRIPIGKIKQYAMKMKPFNDVWQSSEETMRMFFDPKQYREFTTVDDLDNEGRSLLMEAVAHRDWDGFRMLLSYGIHLDVPDDEGVTPLMVSIVDTFSVDRQMFHALIEAGADLDVQTPTGMTALMYARRSGSPFYQSLIMLGADTSIKNKAGQRAGQMTVEPGFPR